MVQVIGGQFYTSEPTYTLQHERAVLKFDAHGNVIVSTDKWNKALGEKGDIGTDLDITPSPAGDKTLYGMMVDCPGSTDAATLEIFLESDAGTQIFDGYVANRDANGIIWFPEGKTCATNWTVKVTGGSGDLIVMAMYK
jgi:hypothetical protein